MNKRFFSMLFFLIAGSQFIANGAGQILPVILQGQQTSMWCWAASGSMTMNYIDARKAPTQCVEANTRFGKTTCCTAPSTCVTGGWPQYSNFGFSSKQTVNDTPLTYAQIQTEINANRPINFSWHWSGGGGHMMVVCGWNPGNLVLVLDPLPVGKGTTKWMTYARFVSGPNYTHWRDYYDIKSN